MSDGKKCEKDKYREKLKEYKDFKQKTEEYCNKIREQISNKNLATNHSPNRDTRNIPNRIKDERSEKFEDKCAKTVYPIIRNQKKTLRSNLSSSKSKRSYMPHVTYENDNVRFDGNFCTFSEYNAPEQNKHCCFCNKAHDNEIIAIPTCGHWMHVPCFVQHVTQQRARKERLTCLECKEPYFKLEKTPV